MAFSKIGLHLDLRVQVPPLPALRRMAQEAAGLGVNTLIMEWEASFPFHRHAVISGPLAYTPDEVQAFLRDCAGWGLDVIPLQQCFGHVEYILRHARYAALRESATDLCQVCPSRGEEAVGVFADIFREVAALHDSSFFHIGGDETYLLGECPHCRKQAETIGKSRLYVGYLRRLAEAVVQLGKRPLLWADMLLKYPEAVEEMPRECVFVDWNYGWPLNKFGDFRSLAALPFEVWGAVAMRSAPDNHSSHAWVTHLENLRQYIPVAREMNFRGIVMTSWSTSGIYGYEWEMTGRPLALFPVRRATPHAGLPILMEAFAAAWKQEGPLDGPEFVASYARARFGFDQADGQNFRDALWLSDRSEGWETRPDAQGDLRKAAALLERLRPLRNRKEFARYRLLVKFGEYQSRVLQLDTTVQSRGFSREDRDTLRRQAEALVEEGEILEREFDNLYEGELHPGELAEESRYRMKRIRNLAARLGGPEFASDSSARSAGDLLPGPSRARGRAETPELTTI